MKHQKIDGGGLVKGKKQAARLEARRKMHDTTVGSRSGFKRPGSRKK